MPEMKPRVWNGHVKEFTPSETPECKGVLNVPYVEPARVTEADAQKFQDEYCFACPILIECARHAMNNEPYGTWGLTENQRASLGGVVAEEWAEKKVDPHAVIAELEALGLDLDTITTIASAAGPRNQHVYRAIAERRRRKAAAARASQSRAA